MSIKKNTLWNLFGSISPMLVGLLVVPIILKGIGLEKLGILTLIWAMIGYFSVFDFGLGRALTQKISSLIALGQHNRYVAVAKSGMALVVLAGFAGSAVLVFSILTFGVRWLKLSPDVVQEVTNSILIAAIAIPITTATSGLKGILEGMSEFKVVNLYKFGLGLANFITPVISITLYGNNLLAIVSFLVLSRIIIMFAYIWSVKVRSAYIYNGEDSSNHADIRDLIVFGSWMTLSNLLGPLMSMADRFLISAMVGASLVAYYTIPCDFLVRLLIIPAALTATLFPVFAGQLLTNHIKAKVLYKYSFKIIFISMLVILVPISIFAHFGLSIWLDKNFADMSYKVVLILSVGILFNSMAQLPFATIQANGDAKTTSLVHLFEFILYAPILYFMVLYYGINGAACAWTLRAVFDFAVLQYIAINILSNINNE